MSSKAMKEGFDKAPQRSLLHALGLTNEEIDKPLVGIVSSYNEIVPGHMNRTSPKQSKWALRWLEEHLLFFLL